MPRKAQPKPPKGQLVRLTTRDYQMLLEACRMADQWRGSKMADEIDEFDEMSQDRWNSLWKIRDAVYPRGKIPKRVKDKDAGGPYNIYGDEAPNYVTCSTIHGRLIHWLPEIEVVGPSCARALCGATPSSGTWIENNWERGTCPRCIKRLPPKTRKALYPTTRNKDCVHGVSPNMCAVCCGLRPEELGDA